MHSKIIGVSIYVYFNKNGIFQTKWFVLDRNLNFNPKLLLYQFCNCRCYTNVFRAKLSQKLKEKPRQAFLEISCRDSLATMAPGLIRGIDHLRDPSLNKVINKNRTNNFKSNYTYSIRKYAGNGGLSFFSLLIIYEITFINRYSLFTSEKEKSKCRVRKSQLGC